MKKDTWVTAAEATAIISGQSGRTIRRDYINQISRKYPQKIASKSQDGRTKLYLRSDVEKIVVSTKRGPKPKQVQQVEEERKEIKPNGSHSTATTEGEGLAP